MSAHAPLVVFNTVGLTRRWLKHAPRLAKYAEQGWVVGLEEINPAVTCAAQATMLTGALPSQHGIVANGWHIRETGEIRFWQQSNRLIQREPIYARLKRQMGDHFRVAKLFWWFNQGAEVDLSVTPKPYYGADGSKVFGITGSPESLPSQLEADLGAFPFFTFWGPRAGLPCTQWIARSAQWVLRSERPDLTLVYLPHLDYEPQRHGPANVDMPTLLGQLDSACEPLLDEADRQGAQVLIVSEYGHADVSRPVLLNRHLRQAGLLQVRDGPFGETLNTFESQAFAVCDHQLAHISVKREADRARVVEFIAQIDGVDRVYEGESRSELGLDHPRSGDVIALASPDAWFAYPYWLNEARAPDFARCVDIHRKPGFDPCEMFVDPKFRFPMMHVGKRLIQKKLGFRMLMDVIPLDPTLVRGSHGRPAADPLDRPIMIGSGAPPHGGQDVPMSQVYPQILKAFGLSD